MNVMLRNANLVQDGRILPCDIMVRGRWIEGVYPTGQQKAKSSVDLRGLYVSAGFIDMHVHGGGGHDFMDGTPEAFRGAGALHLRHGTTAMMPTTLVAGEDELLRCFAAYQACGGGFPDSAKFIGLHLEGPYISPAQCGALDPRYAKPPNPAEYLRLIRACPAIKRWTLAPELDGAMEMANALRSRGIVASMGHSDADAARVKEAVRHGFSLVTHLYSAMSSVVRVNGFRRAGIVECAYLLESLSSEIIADGCHLPEELLALAYRHIGPGRLALVTDAMRGAGQPQGKSILGSLENGREVFIEDGVAKLMDRSAFAGSVCTADRLVRTMVYTAGASLPDAVCMLTRTPARILGIEQEFGYVAEGRAADLIAFDHLIDVKMVWTDGEIRYENGVRT